MKKKSSPFIKVTKESPEARKKRISSGVKFRAVIMENKKRKLREQEKPKYRDYDYNM